MEYICDCGERKFVAPNAAKYPCLACECYAFIEEATNIDEETFAGLLLRAGRNHGPALLYAAHSSGVIDDEVIGRHVGSIWSGVEFPDRTLEWDEWMEFFEIAGYRVDGTGATLPTEPIRLYRAAASAHVYGHSWTDDLAVAQHFLAVGYRDTFKPSLWTAEVEPERLLAYIADDRPGESHYVIDTTGLEVVEVSPEYHEARND